MLLFSMQAYSQTGPTDCGCDDQFVIGSPQWQACQDNCEDVDIPVNGNIWLLAVAGGLFVLYKKRKDRE